MKKSPHRPVLAPLGLLLLVFTLSPGAARAGEETESGLDVSGWPLEIQRGHDEFEKHCADCHELKLALQKHYAPRTWRKYIVKMMKKEDGELDADSGRRIYKFLTFYGRNRADQPPKQTAPAQKAPPTEEAAPAPKPGEAPAEKAPAEAPPTE